MTDTEKRKKVICDLMKDDLYVPMKEKELAILLQVDKKDRELLKSILDELEAEGRISLTSKGKYIVGSLKAKKVATSKGIDKDTLIGTFISNSKGFGFVEVEGREDDLFIPEDKVGGAFHKDVVEVAILQSANGGNNNNGKGGVSRRVEARVVKILSHGITQVVGTYQKSKNFGFVIADNTKLYNDIFIPNERSKGAVDGHKVVVELTSYGSNDKSPEGKIVEIIGHINDPGVDIMSIVKGYELPIEFGEKVMNQVERVPKEVLDSDLDGRKDLRDVDMVTIDGEDAKDLDDAVSLTFANGIYRLGVHIADVTNYVQENSALDREAKERGTSVYLVDRVIPMLPHALSNGICSLNAGVDRLALSCIMSINEKGEIIDHEITESVICVNRRMSYTSVNKILMEHDPEECKEYEELVPMFEQMETLAELLRKRRKKRGSIDFDFPESKIILDKMGHPIDIKPYERHVSNRMIEDFMLAANETIAEHYFWMESPFVYRVHETPDAEKIQKLSTFIHNFGYYMKSVGKDKGKVSGVEVHPKEIQKLLESIEGTKEEALISRLALRSMKQAKYSTESTGHFGLACEYYCHFTSPIRRYPDLQIHRIIKDDLRGRLNDKKKEHYNGILELVAKHSSETERRADEAERDTDKLKKAEYMEERLFQSFEGVISGVTGWGIYVELPNTVEGLVHISKLPGDYYFYDEKNYEIIGEKTGKKFVLGEPVTVQAVSIDRMNRTIDFELVEPEEGMESNE